MKAVLARVVGQQVMRELLYKANMIDDNVNNEMDGTEFNPFYADVWSVESGVPN